MDKDQLTEIKILVEKTINTTVNGKIDTLNKKIDTYIEQDNAWKESIMPSINAVRNTRTFADGVGYVLKSVGLFGGAAAVVYTFIKFLKS